MAIANDNDIRHLLASNPDFLFHKTGSHFFGTAHSLSDFDYYVQDSDEVRSWLLSIGFKFLNTRDPDAQDSLAYNDHNLTTVLRHSDNYQVDVQCVKSAELKTKVQAVLLANNTLRGLTKPQAKRVWNAMYDLLDVASSKSYFDDAQTGRNYLIEPSQRY